jgi:hypothetical protein
MVLPHHHVDASMTRVTLCVFHVPYMDIGITRTNANISSMNVDSSLLTGLG